MVRAGYICLFGTSILSLLMLVGAEPPASKPAPAAPPPPPAVVPAAPAPAPKAPPAAPVNAAPVKATSDAEGAPALATLQGMVAVELQHDGAARRQLRGQV